MKKYLQVFKISLQQEFAYRASFIMWRVRNVLQIFLVFFLWDAVFSQADRIIFGYDRERILTYVFGLLVVRAFVLSARAQEVAGEISRGELSNHLLKPLNYFKYFLTRDISSKTLNLGFAIFETMILYFLLKPPFFVQTNVINILAFIVSIVIAMLIFFILIFIISSIPFWVPEAGWAVHFLFTGVAVEFLSGALFPLDVLPQGILGILNLTPFPYLIFFPLQVYLGKIAGFALIRGLIISGLWVGVLWFTLNSVWRRGLKVYQAHGR